jgi:ferrochelatase
LLDSTDKKRVAVVLFQLGGPDSPEAIEPFLYNLFSDPDIIDFPFARLARPVMARLISSRRARKVQEHYASIGGKSPLRELTERQAVALESELRKTLDARVFVAMRYWHPLTQEAVKQVLGGDFEELILLPLYPQYSRTTTGSSLNEWQRLFKSRNGSKPLTARLVREFYEYAPYLDAMVEKINEGLAKFGASQNAGHRPALQADDVHLVFSAHGVPVSVIEAGDPYQAQIEATTKLVMERGGWVNPHWQCYQSRVSPGRWLRPMLHETLREIATGSMDPKSSRVLVVPVAFVSDHVETLSEINIEARELASQLGLGQFELMPALNDSPSFIRALSGLVHRELASRGSALDNAVQSQLTV